MGRPEFTLAELVGYEDVEARSHEALASLVVHNVINKLAKEANVNDAYPHKFRRTLATNLLDKGMNIQNVAEILGHADLKTTQIYCYMNRNNVKNSYNKYI